MTTTVESVPPFGSPPGRLPLAGHALSVLRRPMEFIKEQRSHGDLVQLWLGPQSFYIVNTPELLRELLAVRHGDFVKGKTFDMARPVLGDGLLSSDGEFHRRQRQLIQPAFHHDRVAHYAIVMRDVAELHSERWNSGQTIEFNETMMEIALTVVMKSLFSEGLDNAVLSEFMSLQPTLLRGFVRRAFLPVGVLHKIPTPENRRYDRAGKRSHEIVNGFISAYRAKGTDQENLLSDMLNARVDGDSMTDAQVHDELVTLMMAGTDTSAAMMAWMFHVLATRPDVGQGAYDEVDEVTSGSPLALRDVSRLVYLRQVVKETLRMYAPAWVLPRRALVDTTLGGHPIPAGANVLYSPYALHHDPRLFTRPERFDPDRWTPQREKDIPRFAYLPFGAGQRICVGEEFAVTEAVIVAATILRTWRLSPEKGHRTRHNVPTVLWPDRVPITIERRSTRP